MSSGTALDASRPCGRAVSLLVQQSLMLRDDWGLSIEGDRARLVRVGIQDRTLHYLGRPPGLTSTALLGTVRPATTAHDVAHLTVRTYHGPQFLVPSGRHAQTHPLRSSDYIIQSRVPWRATAGPRHHVTTIPEHKMVKLDPYRKLDPVLRLAHRDLGET